MNATTTLIVNRFLGLVDNRTDAVPSSQPIPIALVLPDDKVEDLAEAA